jgi:hypothetical protein
MRDKLNKISPITEDEVNTWIEEDTELPTVLTDIKQLEGKTITLIDTFDSYDSQTLFFTEDNHILVERKISTNIHGDHSVITSYMEDMVEIYSHYESELTDWLIITEEQEKILNKQLEDKYEVEARKMNEDRDKLEYEEYLRLKKKYEVDWKL